MSSKSTNIASISKPKGSTLARPLNLSTKGLNDLTRPASIGVPSSVAFDIKHALNPLIAITSPILMAINNIDCSQYSGSHTLLYETFIKEIKTFEEKARKFEYRSAIILATRYFICSYIDEVLSNQDSKLQTRWKAQPLLKTLQNESCGGERFFQILDRASDDPKSNLELLELGFYILNLGYKGKYKNPENNESDLDHIRDNLYTIIKKYRNDCNTTLFISDANTEVQSTNIKKKRRIPHFYIAGGLFILGVLGVSIPYQTHLQTMTKPLIAELKQLKADNSGQGGNLHV